MKRLLVVVVLLVAGIVGLGFYRGWFRFSTDNTDPNVNATITVDKDKIQADKEKVHDLGQEAQEKTGDRTDKVKHDERQP